MPKEQQNIRSGWRFRLNGNSTSVISCVTPSFLRAVMDLYHSSPAVHTGTSRVSVLRRSTVISVESSQSWSGSRRGFCPSIASFPATPIFCCLCGTTHNERHESPRFLRGFYRFALRKISELSLSSISTLHSNIQKLLTPTETGRALASSEANREQDAVVVFSTPFISHQRT